MLAHIAACARPKAPAAPHEDDAFMSTAQRLKTTAIHRPGGGPVARGQPFTRAGPDTAHHRHRGGGHRSCGPMCSSSCIAATNDVRCDVASIRRSYCAYRFAGHRRSHALCQPGGPRWSGIRRLPRLEAHRPADDHRHFNPAGVPAPGVEQRLADSGLGRLHQDRDRPPGTAVLRDRTSSCMRHRRSSKARGTWRPTGPPRDTRRRHGAPVIGRTASTAGNNPRLPGRRHRWAR